MKYSFPILLLFSFLLITGCGDTNDMEDTTSSIDKGRTFTVRASMPEDDAPSTRTISSQKIGTKDIELKWTDYDDIQLYFKSGEMIYEGEYVGVYNISADGKTADFDVVIPDEVTGSFDLYGVHNVQSKISENGKALFLYARPTGMNELEDLRVPIYFEKKGLNSGSTSSDVSFKHYGALQVLTIKNKTENYITLKDPNIDFSGDKWYYDVNNDEDTDIPVYDIVSGHFSIQNVGFSSWKSPIFDDYIFENDKQRLAQWVAPNEKVPPAINIKAVINNVEKTTSLIGARSEALQAGRAYHLYAVWDGTDFKFTNGEAMVDKITMTTSLSIGSKIRLSTYTSFGESEENWIDLNGNGKKDSGEDLDIYSSKDYTVGSQTITIYGRITQLYCDNNKLTTLDVTKNSVLTELNCFSSELTSLNVARCAKLTNLDCSSNKLTTLDIAGCTKLTDLDCSSNKLTTLDVTGGTALKYLYCKDNELNSLDVTKNTALEVLNCENNKLTELYTTGSIALESLDCTSNEFITLNVSECTALTSFSCDKNSELESLDVTGCENLTHLYCDSTSLKELNLTYNKELNYLKCSYSKLTSLDVTQNTKLTYLRCHSNAIFGTAMDNLINSLPNRSGLSNGYIYIFNTADVLEKNVFTKAQWAIADGKNWKSYDGGNWNSEYTGSD